MSQPFLPTGAFTGMKLADEVAARTMILALLHRYAALARVDTDHDLIATLFEPDGIVVFGDGSERCPNQLGELTAGPDRPKILRHHLTTADVQFVSADEAHCQSYVLASTDTKIIDHWGEWNDVVRRQSDGRWLFSKKRIDPLGVKPGGWLEGRMQASTQS